MPALLSGVPAPEAIVCLVSSDFVDFNVVSVIRDRFDGSYRDTERGGRALSVIEARVYGLFSYREIVMDEGLGFGFCTVRTARHVRRLVRIVAGHIVERERIVWGAEGSGAARPSAGSSADPP